MLYQFVGSERSGNKDINVGPFPTEEDVEGNIFFISVPHGRFASEESVNGHSKAEAKDCRGEKTFDTRRKGRLLHCVGARLDFLMK